MSGVRSGVVRIRRDSFTWGGDAFTIENLDGKDQSVTFWADDWKDFFNAVMLMKKNMKDQMDEEEDEE